MKTVISIPGDVFKSAERAAKRLGVSRDEFFSKAAGTLAREVNQRDLTANINAALAQADSRLDPILVKMQANVLADERW
jgi:hypothetical protein